MLTHPPHLLALMRSLEVEKARTQSLREAGTPARPVELHEWKEGMSYKGYRFMCPCCQFESKIDYNPPEFIECAFCISPLQVLGVAGQFDPPSPLLAGGLPSTDTE